MPPPPGSPPEVEVGPSCAHLLLRGHQETAEALQAHGLHQPVGAAQAQAQEVAHAFPRHILGELSTAEKLSRMGTVRPPLWPPGDISLSHCVRWWGGTSGGTSRQQACLPWKAQLGGLSWKVGVPVCFSDLLPKGQRALAGVGGTGRRG